MAKYYSKEHEWIEVDGNIGIVGISSYAVEQLGDITFVELPEVGSEFNRSEPVCSIESVKAVSDIYTPVSGKIIAANEKLPDAPEVINESPEKNGWIFKIELTATDEIKDLMDTEAYKKFSEGQN